MIVIIVEVTDMIVVFVEVTDMIVVIVEVTVVAAEWGAKCVVVFFFVCVCVCVLIPYIPEYIYLSFALKILILCGLSNVCNGFVKKGTFIANIVCVDVVVNHYLPPTILINNQTVIFLAVYFICCSSNANI